MILSGWTIYSEGFFSFPLSIHRIAVNSWVRVVILQNEGAYGGRSKCSRNPLSPPPRTPPLDAARCAFTCGGEEKGHDDALPSIEGQMDRIPGRWRTYSTCPALDRVRRKKKNERTNEGRREPTEKKEGGIRFSKKGGKHLLFATLLISNLLKTDYQPLKLHRKKLLP